MPNNDRGFEDIFNWLDQHPGHAKAKAVEGATRGAGVLEDDAKATTAYFGMSGATRASTVAFVATTEDDGSSKANAAENVAGGLLAGFTGHSGAQHLENISDPLSADQVKIVLTVPTDYIKNLETENGGQKAFLGDTLDNAAPFVLELIADALRDLF